eukprot:m.150555 g.150555  ORF g.150555 m.150555 type:complete len:466 (+) comp30732_c0_seq3:1707-3104(+)
MSTTPEPSAVSPHNSPSKKRKESAIDTAFSYIHTAFGVAACIFLVGVAIMHYHTEARRLADRVNHYHKPTDPPNALIAGSIPATEPFSESTRAPLNLLEQSRLLIHQRGASSSGHRLVFPNQTDRERCAHAVFNRNRVRPLADYTILDPVTSTDVISKTTGLVKLDCRGQWGNRLGQYIVARIVAEQMHFGLEVNKDLLDENWRKGHIFPGMIGIPYNKKGNANLPLEKLGKHTYDFESIFRDQAPRTLHMFGYPFDDFSLIKNNSAKIRNDFLRLDLSCITWQQSWPGPNDVVVHIRDYNDCGSNDVTDAKSFVNVPYSYYERIIKSMNTSANAIDKLWLVAQCGHQDAIGKKLHAEYGGIFVPTPQPREGYVGKSTVGDAHDWIFLTASSRMVMAQSSFSWWAAFLSNATEIHYPLVGEWWGNKPRHRWYPDEPRYHFHDLDANEYFRTYAQIEHKIKQLPAL